MLFQIDSRYAQDGIRKFVNDMDGPAFLGKRANRVGCGWVPVGQTLRH